MIRSPQLLILFLALTVTVGAQTPIGGSVFDGNGGPLQSGVVYHATSSITVPAGETLTVSAGAIVKMGTDHTFAASGTLNVMGTAGSPVIITVLADDTAGGDTNGDGPSVGTPDTWRTLRFNGGATGTAAHLEVRFAGRFANAGIEIESSAVVNLADSRVTGCSGPGLDMNGGVASTVTDCAFDNNNQAVIGVPITGLPNLTNNTATGNVLNDTITISNGSVPPGSNIVITTANMLSNVVFSPSITVQSGATLSFDQGTIIKFQIDRTLSVDGTLNCTGVAGNPVVFTTVDDDARGGDSNNNGMATVATPDFWRTIEFDTAAQCTLNETEVRYAGRFANAGIEVRGAPLTLTNSRIFDCSQAGIDLNNIEAAVNVTGCDIQRCNRAIEGVPLESLPHFTANTASNNVVHDTIQISSASLTSGTTTVTQDNMLSNVIFASSISVDAGVSLVFDEGCIIKLGLDSLITVNGNLTCNGTQAAPVVFTTTQDDTQGGDSNNDGAMTVPGPDWWRTIQFNGTATGLLTQTDLWYTGRFANAGFEMFGADVTLDSCSANFGSQAGLDLNNIAGTYQFLNCAWSANDRAVEGVPLAEVPHFVDNIASSNTTSDTLRVSSGSISSGTTNITSNNMVSGTILCPSITVAPGAKLSFGSGCIMKMNIDTTVAVDGELECLGSAGSPVVFTDFRDDSFGGDTNKDGASSGAQDWWRTVSFRAGSAASRIENMVVRYTGRFNNAGISIADDITAIGCTVDSGTRDGFDLLNSGAQPTIEDCSVTNCGEIAFDGMQWMSFANLANNTAVGNGGDYARVSSSVVGPNDRVRVYAAPNGVIRMANSPTFAASSSLTLDAGLIVKTDIDRSFVVNAGTFRALGTAYEPVVFTDFNDDTFGGDSNNDGPSTGTQNWWRGLRIDANALQADLEHVIVRFAGRFANYGIFVNNPAATVIAPRVDSSSNGGINIEEMSGDCENAFVFDCGSRGILLGANAPNVVHATVADGVTGIEASSSWTGTVTNTISWNNTTANFAGIADTSIFSSNGSPTAAGMNGNTNVDPMFGDVLNEDYSLAAGSPCIDTADVAAADAIMEDHLETSRRSDDDLSGMVLPDMGAFEKITFNLDVQGEPRIGGMQTYGFTGPMAAMGVLLVTPLNEVATFSPNYGWLLVAPPSEVTLIAAMAPGIPLNAAIPDFPALVDYPFQAQALVVDMTDPTRGNFTQRYRTRIRP